MLLYCYINLVKLKNFLLFKILRIIYNLERREHVIAPLTAMRVQETRLRFASRAWCRTAQPLRSPGLLFIKRSSLNQTSPQSTSYCYPSLLLSGKTPLEDVGLRRTAAGVSLMPSPAPSTSTPADGSTGPGGTSGFNSMRLVRETTSSFYAASIWFRKNSGQFARMPWIWKISISVHRDQYKHWTTDPWTWTSSFVNFA
jgi:hypothetical protein